jgi:hypothetical protein
VVTLRLFAFYRRGGLPFWAALRKAIRAAWRTGP